MKLFDPTQPGPLTVAGVITEYLSFRAAEVAAGQISPRYLEKCRRYLEPFSVDFGHLAIDQCRRGDIKRFLVIHPEYKSAHTIADAAGAIVTCFRWAEEDGLIDRCPYARPKDLPVPQPRPPILPEEVRKILDYCRAHGRKRSRLRFRLALWFLWETGCRTCEMYGLLWDQYDPERGCFVLPGKTTRKTGNDRILALPRRAWRLIRFLHARRSSNHVFISGRGTPWNHITFGQYFRKVAKVCGVRKGISAYCCRHGFTCRRLEAGTGERQLADYLGHSSTRYVGWYGRGTRKKVDYLRSAGEAEG